MSVYKIKCSNGKYVQKTSNGRFITMGKTPKIWNSRNLAYKNLDWCEEFAETEFSIERNGVLTFELETVG